VPFFQIWSTIVTPDSSRRSEGNSSESYRHLRQEQLNATLRRHRPPLTPPDPFPLRSTHPSPRVGSPNRVNSPSLRRLLSGKYQKTRFVFPLDGACLTSLQLESLPGDRMNLQMLVFLEFTVLELSLLFLGFGRGMPLGRDFITPARLLNHLSKLRVLPPFPAATSPEKLPGRPISSFIFGPAKSVNHL